MSHTHHRHPEEPPVCAVFRRMAAGACGPSFEARREERRAPQDDGGVLGGHGARAPLPTLRRSPQGKESRLATFSRAWQLAPNVLVSHISAWVGRRPDDVKFMSAGAGIRNRFRTGGAEP